MAYIGIDIGGTKCAVVRGIGTDIEARVVTTSLLPGLKPRA